MAANGKDTSTAAPAMTPLLAATAMTSMHGGAGQDELWMAATAQDTVNGGTGDDVLTVETAPISSISMLVLATMSSPTSRNNDLIQFDDDLFENPEAVLLASEQVGEDTVITAGTNTVTLLGVQVSSLQANDFYWGNCGRSDFTTVIRQRHGTLGHNPSGLMSTGWLRRKPR